MMKNYTDKFMQALAEKIQANENYCEAKIKVADAQERLRQAEFAQMATDEFKELKNDPQRKAFLFEKTGVERVNLQAAENMLLQAETDKSNTYYVWETYRTLIMAQSNELEPLIGDTKE